MKIETDNLFVTNTFLVKQVHKLAALWQKKMCMHFTKESSPPFFFLNFHIKDTVLQYTHMSRSFRQGLCTGMKGVYKVFALRCALLSDTETRIQMTYQSHYKSFMRCVACLSL